MASKWYPNGIKWLLDNGLDAAGANIKLGLLQAAATYNEAHDFRDDVAANECDRASYAAEAVTLTTQVDAANDRVELLFGADVVFSAIESGNTIEHAFLFYDTGVAGTSVLLAFFDLNTSLPTNGLDITITRDATDGDLRIAY